MVDHPEQAEREVREDARSTLEHMGKLARQRVPRNIIHGDISAARLALKKNRSVYDANHTTKLPGKLAMNERKRRSSDVEVEEAYDGCGAAYDFYAQVFGRNSIDGRGGRLIASVHYATRFDNAMWNGHQVVFGDGDGRLFKRFTASLDVIGHEVTHGVTQYTAGLGYTGQTGALNEHLSDAFGIMVKQFQLGQSANESDWLIGAGLFTSRVHGTAIRSMAAPGTAYDDPVLGRDPQPSHMSGYVDTPEDNGGVHINCGIPNHAFYLAAIALGGKTSDVLGHIWYATVTERLTPDAGFHDFARATVDIAGELYGNGGRVQSNVAEAWSSVGLETPLFDVSTRLPIKRPAARRPARVRKLTERHRRRAH